MEENKEVQTPKEGAWTGTPSRQAQSWGLMISIIVIVLMIVIGAFYAWGERVAQNTPPPITAQ